MKTRSPTQLIAGLMAVVAASCSTVSLPVPDVSEGTAAIVTTTTTPPAAADLSEHTGIVVAIDQQGTVDIMWVDGTLKQQVAGPDETRSAPTWSRYNDLLYWGRSLGAGERIIEAVDPDTSTVISTLSVENLPFFIAPSSNVRQLAHLGINSEVGITLGLGDFAPPTMNTPIGSGEPFYFSWSPDGTTLAQHIGDEAVSLLPTGQLVTTPLETIGSADWTVPFWFDTNTILAVHHDPDDPAMRTLALFDVATQSRRDIARFGGQVVFVPNPERTQIAVQASEPAAGGVPATELTAFQPEETPFADLPAVPPDQLVVIDISTAEITPTDLGAAAAFSWSPIDSKLAALVPADGGAAWLFWKDGLIGQSPLFQPSELSAGSYIPFFTQFAEISPWWSPDGRSFLVSGTIGTTSGIWAQPVNLGAFPTLIDDGDYAFFAP